MACRSLLSNTFTILGWRRCRRLGSLCRARTGATGECRPGMRPYGSGSLAPGAGGGSRRGFARAPGRAGTARSSRTATARRAACHGAAGMSTTRPPSGPATAGRPPHPARVPRRAGQRDGRVRSLIGPGPCPRRRLPRSCSLFGVCTLNAVPGRLVRSPGWPCPGCAGRCRRSGLAWSGALVRRGPGPGRVRRVRRGRAGHRGLRSGW